MSTSASDLEIGESRRRLLREVGTPPDLTVVRCHEGPDDQPAWTGIEELLREHIYREIDRDGLCAARGHTALLSVDGDAFCRPADDLTARALAVAELRFERVIVLPAGFDPSDDTTRAALTASRATIFARDPESFRRIAPLCDARLALDCACFSGATPAIPEPGSESRPRPTLLRRPRRRVAPVHQPASPRSSSPGECPSRRCERSTLLSGTRCRCRRS